MISRNMQQQGQETASRNFEERVSAGQKLFLYGVGALIIVVLMVKTIEWKQSLSTTEGSNASSGAEQQPVAQTPKTWEYHPQEKMRSYEFQEDEWGPWIEPGSWLPSGKPGEKDNAGIKPVVISGLVAIQDKDGNIMTWDKDGRVKGEIKKAQYIRLGGVSDNTVVKIYVYPK